MDKEACALLESQLLEIGGGRFDYIRRNRYGFLKTLQKRSKAKVLEMIDAAIVLGVYRFQDAMKFAQGKKRGGAEQYLEFMRWLRTAIETNTTPRVKSKKRFAKTTKPAINRNRRRKPKNDHVQNSDV